MPETVNAEGIPFQGAYVPSVNLDQLLPVLVNAIAQLSAKVNALTGAPRHTENSHRTARRVAPIISPSYSIRRA
ncbi:hypothetical protein R3J27_08240 [Xylella fastidiosa subsp. multiplex]